jgi:hypothetical protein
MHCRKLVQLILVTLVNKKQLKIFLDLFKNFIVTIILKIKDKDDKVPQLSKTD